MSNNELFQKFMKTSTVPFTANLKQAVVYTRVSSKEQADKNLSLDFQMRTIVEYAKKSGVEVLSYFGGTYESAKTDGRKQFQRMLEYIKKNKGRVSHILVYTLDRFSRTGGGAIKLAQDLRDKYGVTVFAVTQPTDTTNVSGVFQQNIQFLFSEFDNQLRKQRAVAGMKEKFEKGIWCLKPPLGYDVVKVNGERKIVINKIGQHLKKAFQWKLQGMKNEEILIKLKALGLTTYKQKLSQIFSNPFYCGIIVNKMLNGKSITGIHPAIVSEKDFLAVNDIRKSANKFGVPHKDEIEALPLKVFMKCDHCNKSYTGYVVKKKNLYYYKCRTQGCNCNKNAKDLNNDFQTFLDTYTVHPDLIEPLYKLMGEKFEALNSTHDEQLKQLKGQKSALQVKIDNLEESYFITKEMSEETYKKFMGKYSEERAKILDAVDTCGKDSSNLSEYYIAALRFSTKLPTVWASSPVSVKEKIQQTIFPEAILYNHKNQAFRTTKVNEVFYHIASLSSDTG
ncbi:MAG: recombinase family protein, partial [Pedobacter sp.]|nr:recombinase family protein [Pedobacter sp.]